MARETALNHKAGHKSGKKETKMEDKRLREFVATGDIKGLSIKELCSLIDYARAFAPSILDDLLDASFFDAYHY